MFRICIRIKYFYLNKVHFIMPVKLASDFFFFFGCSNEGHVEQLKHALLQITYYHSHITCELCKTV